MVVTKPAYWSTVKLYKFLEGVNPVAIYKLLFKTLTKVVVEVVVDVWEKVVEVNTGL